MTQMNLDDELYKKVKEFIQSNKIEYPSITNFVEKATKKLLEYEDLKK